MDPAMSTIALCSIFAAAVGTLPLALLYRQLTAVVFRELVFVGEDPVKAAPYLSAAAIFPLLATVAWFVSPLIHHPPAIPGNGGISIPVALWAAAIHAGAATLAMRSFNHECRSWRRLGPRRSDEAADQGVAGSGEKSPEDKEREAEALMKAHP
jgi:hypothetical protein